MLKRILSMILCFVMVFSALPIQALAEESVDESQPALVQETEPEVTEPEVSEPEVTEPETTEPEVTEPEVTEPEVTEPEVTEPEVTEPEVTEPEVTEPEATEPEVTEPEATEPEKDRQIQIPRWPSYRAPDYTRHTYTTTEDVRVISQDENGNYIYTDTTETSTHTVLVEEPQVELPVGLAEGGPVSFTTFAELKELASRSYSIGTTIVFMGEGSLTIEEDLTLPENLSLSFCTDNSRMIVNEGVTFSSGWNTGLYVDALIVNGTFENRSYTEINAELTVNGTLRLYNTLYLSQTAGYTCSGTLWTSGPHFNVERNCGVDSVEALKAAVKQASADDSGCVHSITMNLRGDFTLNESVTIPSNAAFYINGADSGVFTIARGAVLRLDCQKYCDLSVELVVAGTLVNNCADELRAEKITITSTGSYQGNGLLSFTSKDSSCTLEDFVTGLDMTHVQTWQEHYGQWYYWYLRDISGLTKLGTPTALQWHKEYTYVRDPEQQSSSPVLVDRKGCITWKPVEPDQGHARVTIYKEGQAGSYSSGSWHFGSEHMPEYRSVDSFIMGDPESGTYSFTVQSQADGTGYANSDIARSGTWKYTRPNSVLGGCSNLSWSWPELTWDVPADSTQDTEYEVKFFFSSARDAEPRPVGGIWGPKNGRARVNDKIIQANGSGYYYFRVRALSEDITRKCNGPWSEMSPAFNLNTVTQDVKQDLTDIDTTAAPEEIRSAVQSLDTESLKSAMLADSGSEGVMDTLKALEDAAGGAAGVQVSEEVNAFDAEKVSIVGANLNNAAEASSEPIQLVIDKPRQEHVLEAAYDNAVAVSFAMTLENAADAENLDVPVKVTLPVPEGINPEFLVILHYKQDGTVEELVNGVDVHIFRDGTGYAASFVLTSFSDFVMTHIADRTQSGGGDETGITWAVSTWNELRISGTGAMDDDSDTTAPWESYKKTITKVTVGEGVTHIGIAAFKGLTALTEVTMADSVTSIGDEAFAGCGALARITIGAGVDTIGRHVFDGCRKLSQIPVAEGNENYATVDGVLFTADGTVLVAYPGGANGNEYTLPEGTKFVYGGAFCGNTKLRRVVLPESLLGIETEAFANCRSLARIEFLGNPPSIGENAFANVNATAVYPAANKSWTQSHMGSYGGKLTWKISYYLEINGEDRLLGSKSAKLTARILPLNNNLTAGIVWSLDSGDEAYASLKSSGATVTVTARDVSEPHTVTLRATASQDRIAPGEFKLEILPRVKRLAIREGNRELEPGFPRLISLDASNETGFEIQLEAEALPSGAITNVSWKSSNPAVATIDETGRVCFTGRAGTVKFTATDRTEGKVKTEVTYKTIRLSEIYAPTQETIHITGGQSRTLQVLDQATDKPIPAKHIHWSLDTSAGDPSAFATINASGKLTTRKVSEVVELLVKGTLLVEGLEGDSVYYDVIVHPATSQVELSLNGEPVNGRTIPYDVTNPAPMTLGVNCYPFDAINTPVKWTISDSKGAYAQYVIDEADGTLTIGSPTGKVGVVTITAAAQDGSGKKATVKLSFGTFAAALNITNTEQTLAGGSRLVLNAQVQPEAVTKPGVVWSLKDPADKAYVSLSGNKLTAKTVYADHPVTVVAASKDGCVREEYTVTIVPKDPKLLILQDQNGANVTMGKVYVDLNGDPTVTLSAHSYTGAEETVTWTPGADVKNAAVTRVGDDLKVTMRSGSLTVKAQTADGRKATVTLVSAKLASAVTITGANMTTDDTGRSIIPVASGKSVSLKATLVNATGKKVAWSVTEGGAYAKISSSGKLTAVKDLTSEKRVTVRATAQDGSNAFAEVTVLIKPLAQGLQIYSEDENGIMLMRLSSSDRARGNTTLVWDMAAEDEAGNPKTTIRLSSLVFPFYDSAEAHSALQTVTWKSSNPKVAQIDGNGVVTCRKAGTVTITAAAADGSGQKISFKLNVVKRIKQITLPNVTVVGGKKITLKPEITPVDATSKKLTWFMTGDTEFAKLSNGVLTTYPVTSVKRVNVYAYAKESGYVTGYCTVTIYPASAQAFTLKVWGPQEDQMYPSSWLPTMCEKFNNEHPEWNITFVYEDCLTDLTLETMLQSPTPPDVFVFYNDHLNSLIEARCIAPLTGANQTAVLANNPEAVVASVSDVTGQVYGVPFTGNTWFMYYDKSVFTEEDVKSLDTMLEKGKVSFPLTNAWHITSFFLANGGTMFGENGLDVDAGIDFGGEKGTAVAEYLVGLVNNPNFVVDVDGSGMAGLRDGSVNVLFSGSWAAAAVKEALGDNFAAAQLPTANIGGSAKQMRAFAGCEALGVSPNSENPEAAAALAVFLGSAEAQLAHYEMRGIIPTSRALISDAAIQADPVALAQLRTLANTASNQPTLLEMSYYWPAAEDFGKAIVSGGVTLDNAAEKVETFNNRINAYE